MAYLNYFEVYLWIYANLMTNLVFFKCKLNAIYRRKVQLMGIFTEGLIFL